MTYAERITSLPLPDKPVAAYSVYALGHYDAKKSASAIAAEADAELTALRERVTELEVDATRLDWLAGHLESCTVYEADPTMFDDGDSGWPEMWRKAIDAAINKGKAPSTGASA